MSEDDQTESETKKPRTRGTRPTDRGAAAGGEQPTMQTMGAPQQGGAFPAPRRMPWDQQGGGAAAMGGGGPQQAGGHPAFQWGGGMQGGGGFQPGGIMGGQGQGGMPNWQALAQQFMQRFQGHPMMQRLGMTGQGMRPPGQAPAAPPQASQGGMQPGAAQGGPLQGRIQQLAQMFGQRQQPGGIVGPGRGPQEY